MLRSSAFWGAEDPSRQCLWPPILAFAAWLRSEQHTPYGSVATGDFGESVLLEPERYCCMHVLFVSFQYGSLVLKTSVYCNQEVTPFA